MTLSVGLSSLPLKPVSEVQCHQIGLQLTPHQQEEINSGQVISPTARVLHWTVLAPIQNFQEPFRYFIWNIPLTKNLLEPSLRTFRQPPGTFVFSQQPCSESLSNLPGFPLHKKRSSERALPGTCAGTSRTSCPALTPPQIAR